MGTSRAGARLGVPRPSPAAGDEDDTEEMKLEERTPDRGLSGQAPEPVEPHDDW
jgi:hypothetical protein